MNTSTIIRNHDNHYTKHTLGIGEHMVASKSFEENDIITVFEEKPHRLVSRAWVESNWDATLQKQFHENCWPLTDDLFVMWDTDPSQWSPINHSCDPNAWVTGLNLMARRNIQPHEEITMDYATMYTEGTGASFQCKCGSNICRGEWKGTDYRQEWFKQIYGDHVTDHVRQKTKLISNGRVE